jgi:hypothetical protein
LNQYLQPTKWSAPFSLGYFPFTLYNIVKEELQRADVRLHLARSPVKRNLPVVLLMDGDDYIVADDFEVDVPDFEHRPEWFAPT